jgi:hypothetical protein
MSRYEYNVVMSIGMRCFTEIFLKSMGLKKFSSPFDGMYSTNIYNIIDIFHNGINYENLIFSENIIDSNITLLNKEHGFRTMKKSEIDINNLNKSFHNAFLPHHNLNDEKCKTHFERCFHRLENIKKYEISTLFCLFVHPGYGNKDKSVSLIESKILSDSIMKTCKGKLLVCIFEKNIIKDNWKIIYDDDILTYIIINNNSHIFIENKNNLKEIFSYMKIDNNKLLSYDEINNM